MSVTIYLSTEIQLNCLFILICIGQRNSYYIHMKQKLIVFLKTHLNNSFENQYFLSPENDNVIKITLNCFTIINLCPCCYSFWLRFLTNKIRLNARRKMSIKCEGGKLGRGIEKKTGEGKTCRDRLSVLLSRDNGMERYVKIDKLKFFMKG